MSHHALSCSIALSDLLILSQALRGHTKDQLAHQTSSKLPVKFPWAH